MTRTRISAGLAALVVAGLALLLATAANSAFGAAGKVSTVAGGKTSGGQADCADPRPATSACLNLPVAIAFDSAGNLYISDNDNHEVRKVSGGTMSTIAGTGHGMYCGDEIGRASCRERV